LQQENDVESPDPSEFAQEQQTATQGGAAAPLTLGYIV
jgi:hypothetical protein